MKNIYTVLALLICTIIQAQIVNIPDANFKNALLNHNSFFANTMNKTLLSDLCFKGS